MTVLATWAWARFSGERKPLADPLVGPSRVEVAQVRARLAMGGVGLAYVRGREALLTSRDPEFFALPALLHPSEDGSRG